MTQYNYEFLQETFDEQQTAIATITNSLTFLTQIRANQKRQLMAMHNDLIQSQSEIERLKTENAELRSALDNALNAQPTRDPFNPLKGWVGNFRCHSYGQKQ